MSKTVTLEKPSWFNLMAHTSPDIPPPMIATVGSRDEDICKTCLLKKQYVIERDIK